MVNNDFSNIDGDSDFRDLARQDDRETFEDTPLGEQYGDGLGTDDNTGWPGDGSGMDDLADYNANEADDYRDE